jgi:hypothetical protein
MNTVTINLERYRAKSKDGKFAKVFTGRDRGKDVRILSKIDSLEEDYDRINFIIPDEVYSIHPSFYEELFVNVVLKLGRDKFYEKFIFDSLGDYDYERNLSEAVTRILRNKTALD